MVRLEVLTVAEAAAISEAKLFGIGGNLAQIVGFVRAMRQAFAKLGLTKEEVQAIIAEVRELIETGFTIDGALRLLALIMESIGTESPASDEMPTLVGIHPLATYEPQALDPATLLLLFQLANTLLPILQNAAKLMRERIKERRAQREDGHVSPVAPPSDPA